MCDLILRKDPRLIHRSYAEPANYEEAHDSARTGRPRKYYPLEPAGARQLMATYSPIHVMAGGLIPRLTDLAEG